MLSLDKGASAIVTMMNYVCVRRELLPAVDGAGSSSYDRDETSRMEVYGSLSSTSRPRRYLSEPTDSCDEAGRASPTLVEPPPGGEEGGASGGACRAVHPENPVINNEKFDFYLAVPEQDVETFGIPFCKMVEDRMGMKPCLSIRDIVPGRPKFEAIAHTLETRCNGKVVFVISKNFSLSDECRFLVHFAKTLDPDAMSFKLIPLEIDKEVKLPRVLEGLTTINYNAAVRERWLGRRLWEAVHGTQPKPAKGFWSRVRSISAPS